MHPCDCCGYLTMETRGDYDICPVCYWEDDGWHEEGGANYVSLAEAQANFQLFGAVEMRLMQFVRQAEPTETPERGPSA